MRTVYGPIYTLRPYERGIQETLGKYTGFVMPGLGIQIPFIHITRIRDLDRQAYPWFAKVVVSAEFLMGTPWDGLRATTKSHLSADTEALMAWADDGGKHARRL